MLYYLHLWSDQISWLRVFQYITVRIVGGAGTAFLISLLAGPWMIRRLARMGAGSRYQEDQPALNALRGSAKKHTPSMGGLLILLAMLVSCLLWANPVSSLLWLTLATMLVMGAIGFIDDYLKAVRRRPGGLRGRTKLLAQGVWALILTTCLLRLPATSELAGQLMLPFFKSPVLIGLGGLAVFLMTALIVIGASNAVNLTDGLDGLAIGCTGSVALAYLVMSYVAGHAVFAAYLQVPYVPQAGELAVFCGCLLGASLGFLWFNCHPAQIFMGDTGSLALGGAIGCVAVLIKQELALVVVGGVFVAEAVSVILQVVCFKLTGRRIFHCSPLHHHFELKPARWSETQVTVRFWILAGLCAIAGILLLKIR